jgi:Zn-finger nucleic acid-binding protein
MNCPVCETATLSLDDDATDLRMVHCPRCHGRWVQSYRYWQWRERQGKSLPERSAGADDPAPTADSPAGKRCPECGHFLIRYPVGHDLPFHLDRCGCCGGVWLDADEWEALKARNLHDDLHLIFSTVWQAAVRQQEQRETRTQRYITILGQAGYQRVRDFKAWADAHTDAPVVYALLNDHDDEG